MIENFRFKTVTVKCFGENPSLIRYPAVNRVRVLVERIRVQHFVVPQVLEYVAGHGGLTSECFRGWLFS